MKHSWIVVVALTACSTSTDAPKSPPATVTAPTPAPAPSGPPADAERELAPYTEVVNGSPFEVVLAAGAGKVRVDAPAEWLPRIDTRVEAGRLWIELPGGTRTAPPPIRVVVPAEGVVYAVAAGSGAVRAETPLRAPRIRLATTGTGALGAEVAADTLVVEVIGSGGITVTGAAARVEAKLTGSGSLAADRLSATDASVTLSGSGSAELTLSGALTCALSGSGSLRYQGPEAAASACVTTGSGRIERR